MRANGITLGNQGREELIEYTTLAEEQGLEPIWVGELWGPAAVPVLTQLLERTETIAAVGGYEDTDDVLEEAVRELLRRRPELRTSLAVEKYRTGAVSLNRAAELAGMSTERFKDELADRGVSRDAGFLEAKERETELDSGSKQAIY